MKLVLETYELKDFIPEFTVKSTDELPWFLNIVTKEFFIYLKLTQASS